MFNSPERHRKDEGYVLVTALMIMMVLTLLGIAINRYTEVEIKISGKDKFHKETFYQADGGTEYAAEIIEQNIACIDFAATGDGVAPITGGLTIDTNIAVDNGSLQLWQNPKGLYSEASPFVEYPSDAVRDLWLPPNSLPGEPHTNITVEGVANLATGASIIMAGGYLGLGRSASSGGVTLDYEIDSRHLGTDNSETLIRVNYRHVVGKEDPFCRYN